MISSLCWSLDRSPYWREEERTRGADREDDLIEPDATLHRLGQGVAQCFVWNPDGQMDIATMHRILTLAIDDGMSIVLTSLSRGQVMSHRLRHHLKAFGDDNMLRMAQHKVEQPIEKQAGDFQYWGALLLDTPALVGAAVPRLLDPRHSDALLLSLSSNWLDIAQAWGSTHESERRPDFPLSPTAFWEHWLRTLERADAASALVTTGYSMNSVINRRLLVLRGARSPITRVLACLPRGFAFHECDPETV